MPVTTPSAPSPSCSQLASRPSSASDSGSSSRSTRSRTGSFCCSATFCRCLSGPPPSAASRAALTSLTETSGSQIRFVLGLCLVEPGVCADLALEPGLVGGTSERIELLGLVEDIPVLRRAVVRRGGQQSAAELLGVGQHVV